MPKPQSRRPGGGGKSKRSAPPGPRIKKIQTYEDTLEEGGLDHFMFKRDQIMFNPQDESDEDINADQGEEVLGLNLPSNEEYEEGEEDDYSEEEALPKQRKTSTKADLSGKGRFGKPIPTSDEEASSSGSDSEDLEGWGRQYYSRPSNRREKEKGGYDETREEEREMEEREVKRLQRKAREGMSGADWGLDEGDVQEVTATIEAETAPVPVPNAKTTDLAALLRHLEAYEPVKLALARDFPLVVHKLVQTSKGIKEMSDEADGEESLHKGLGWLHYQTLLTYAATLAFYIYLCALPSSSRPNLATHPIMPRLLQLKEGVTMLEDLDFAAGTDESKVVIPGLNDDDEEELANNRELVGLAAGEEDDDADDLWQKEGLEDGELEDLMADAENEMVIDKQVAKPIKEGKKRRRLRDKPEDKPAKAKPKSNGDYVPLTEPAFFSASSKKAAAMPTNDDEDDDTLGDPSSLTEADATDKERRKRSLRFHTSKIAATSARRSAARTERLGGDEDLPYRDRKAARNAALRKNGPQGAEGEDLEPIPEKKRVREEPVDDGDDDGEGYYDLVKRRRTEENAAKEAEHVEVQAARFSAFDEDAASGPRAVTRAIEKNRGLTPRRAKTGRNPRVKKRQAYEKAKQKVASQRAVFKGGQASLGGAYSGEKTGISTAVKSRRF